MKKLLMFPLIAALAACSGEASAPESPTVYKLISANGVKVPYVWGRVDNVTVTLVADTLLVDSAASTYHQIGYVKTPGQADASTGHTYGVVTVSSSLAFRETIPDTATFVGTRHRDTLTIQRHDSTFKYLRH